jgi:hypothetical protein
MHLELTNKERCALLGALEVYRRVKGAEGKLAAQRLIKTDKNAATQTSARYAALLDVVTNLNARLQ